MKRNIVLLYAIALLQGMVFYGPAATLYREAQGVSVSQIALIESISLILCLALEIPWGVLADRIGYRRTMVFCCGLYFVSKIVFWQARGFWWFLAERILLSIVIAGLSGVDTSILYLSCKEGESQKTFGIYNSLSTAGLLIAAIVFSVFIGSDYRLAGGLTAVSYGLAAFAALFLTEVRQKEQRHFRSDEFRKILRQTLRDRSFLLFLAAVAFFSETHQIITVFLNQVKYAQCGLLPAQMGYLYAAVTLAGLFGSCSSRITKKFGEKRSCTLFYVMSIAACLLLALTGKAAFSVGGILLLRVTNSLFQPLQLELQNRQIQTANRATALSINAMVIDSVSAGTNLIFGCLADFRLNSAFLFGAGLCFCGLCLFRGWYRHATPAG